MGGYGIVFKARDSELNRVVAIKVLAPHLMNSGPVRNGLLEKRKPQRQSSMITWYPSTTSSQIRGSAIL